MSKVIRAHGVYLVALVVAVVGTTACVAQSLSVVGYNVESGGADPDVVAGVIRDFNGVDIWGLSEVRNDDWANTFETAAEHGEGGADFQQVLGTTGGADRLLIIYDNDRLELVEHAELHRINPWMRVRSPLVARFRLRTEGDEFLFVVNHLYRSRAARRHDQSTLLNRWGGEQTVPIIAVGDYNYDWDVDDGDIDHDQGYDNLVAGGVFNWVRPADLVKTQDSSFSSVLDFVFLGGPSWTWRGSSTIHVRSGDFPDDGTTSDHRPVSAQFHLSDPPPGAPAGLTDAGGGLLAPPVGVAESGLATIEFYPDEIQARLEARDRELRRLPGTVAGNPFDFVITTLKRWEPEQTVTVAFNGGDSALHARIAEAASEWAEHGNINLDFGYDGRTETYRTWKGSDSEYAADIRVAFHYRGYWSLVGTDSNNPQIVGPGVASMNLSGFDRQLPNSWRATVLHEFGHALGFQHEHQHPRGGCDSEFRWDDDPGYVPTTDQLGQYIADSQGRRPGIYTVLGGPPNEWPRAKVDHNLRQFRDSDAYETGQFDAHSIMKYYFPAWMFTAGTESHCFTGNRNNVLSTGDIEGIATAYPMSEEDAEKKIQQKELFLDEILQLKSLPMVQRPYFEARQERLRKR